LRILKEILISQNYAKFQTIQQGYSCLIMVSDNVEGLRQARSEVGHSLRIASSMDYNPRGLANGNGKRLSGDGNVKEKVQFSADLNPKQREKWQQILVGGNG
jgi:hypothetical protein